MKINITMELDPEHVDENDASGLTEESYDDMVDALNTFGTNVEIEKEA